MTAVPDLHLAANSVDSSRARSRQRKLGPSAVGACRRRAGYMVAGTPPTDEGSSKMAAILGTWIHKGALEALRKIYGAAIEVPVEFDLLKGSMDALYLESLTVEDVKTVGRFAYEWREQAGVARGHLMQVHLYAWMLREGHIPKRSLNRLRRLGWTETRVPVEQLIIRYINRDTGDEWAHTQDYDPQITADALAWVAEVYERVGTDGPQALERDEDGPGLSIICDGCQWLTACWGPQRGDGAMRQASLVRDDRDVEMALAEYDQARAVIKEADAVKQLARAKLTASAPGVYGPLQLGWSGGGGVTRSVDMDAVRRLFADAGLDVPEKTSPKSASISVTKPKRST